MKHVIVHFGHHLPVIVYLLLIFVLLEIFGQGVRLDHRIWASKLKFNNL